MIVKPEIVVRLGPPRGSDPSGLDRAGAAMSLQLEVCDSSGSQEKYLGAEDSGPAPRSLVAAQALPWSCETFPGRTSRSPEAAELADLSFGITEMASRRWISSRSATVRPSECCTSGSFWLTDVRRLMHFNVTANPTAAVGRPTAPLRPFLEASAPALPRCTTATPSSRRLSERPFAALARSPCGPPIEAPGKTGSPNGWVGTCRRELAGPRDRAQRGATCIGGFASTSR